MKIAVLGVGAVGGYFGGRLTQTAHEVAFIARGAHLDAIREHGLQIESENGDFVAHPTFATDSPDEIGVVGHRVRDR
jgi:2-dehydropantoate 2-reductase